MSALMTDENSADFIGGDLLQLQRELSRVVVKLVVKDDGGQEVCELETEGNPNGITGAKAIFVGLVGQWSRLHDALIARLTANSYGHISEEEVIQMEAVLTVGALLLSVLREAIKENGNHDDISDHIIDLAGSLRSLSLIRDSYESNPTNKELDSIAAVA